MTVFKYKTVELNRVRHLHCIEMKRRKDQLLQGGVPILWVGFAVIRNGSGASKIEGRGCEGGRLPFKHLLSTSSELPPVSGLLGGLFARRGKPDGKISPIAFVDLRECQQHQYTFHVYHVSVFFTPGTTCVFGVLESEKSGKERDWSGTLGSGERCCFVVLSELGRATDRFFFGTGWRVSMSDWSGGGAVAVGVKSVFTRHARHWRPARTSHSLRRLVSIPLSLVSSLSRLLSLPYRVSLVSSLSYFVSALLLSSVCPVLFLCFLRLSVCLCLSVSFGVFDSVLTKSGSVPYGTKDKRACAHYVPLKSLCPVDERIVAAVCLASATLGSFRQFLRWSSSVFTSCIAACSLVSCKLAVERVQPWAKSSAELQGDSGDSHSSFRSPVIVRFHSFCSCRSRCLLLSSSHAGRRL